MASEVGSQFVPRPVSTMSSEEYQDLSEPGVFSRFYSWLKQDFMVKLGAFLLLLAFGWFVSYAFANNWIGPVGRITIGLMAGVSFLLLGTWRMRQFVHQGGIFTVVGATTILLTLYAARELYNFFTPETALVLMFMTVSFVAFVSVRFASEKLALAGLLLAAFAPLLTAAPLPDVMVVFPYLLVVVAGSLWVVWRTGWTRLTLATLVVSYLHSLPFLGGRIIDQDSAIMFSFLLVGIFFAANVVSLVRRRNNISHLGIHALTALGTVIFLFSWIETAANDVWRSLLYTAWALVFALGTYVVFVATANYKAFYLYGATSIALIGVATAAELDGPILVIMYLAEISLLVMAAAKLRAGAVLLSRLSLILIVPTLLSVESFDLSIWNGVFNENFAVICLTAIVLIMTGLQISLQTDYLDTAYPKITVNTLFVGSSFFLVSLVWLVCHKLFEYDLGTMVSLTFYTIVGIGMFVSGKSSGVRLLQVVGGVLIGLVVARLLLVDVWEMEIEGRIIVFLIVGLLLISTAFIRKLQPQTDN
jgi:hypothetical protein